ncbi:MAG: ATP-binding cassette domain-containing protein [Candidatus Acidiferrum sp.]|jgi:phospholipid/cholesterol/gamma-HCH transport system ATP-binding protein
MSTAPMYGRRTSPGDPDPVVSFDNVRLGFDEGDVLRGVSFRVLPRETLVLLGETGTGKTLTLKLAAGLLHPSRGNVRVLDHEVSIMSEQELLSFRRQIGFVFQEGALFDSMTVADNVAYRLREDRVDEEEIEPRVREILAFVELEHTLDQLPSELSGGMRRRVSIARALVNRPQIVLYDSPTAGLDPVTAQTIITLILRLRDVYGVTALLATHRLQDGFALANFRFDAKAKRVVRDDMATSRVKASEAEPVTRFLVYRDGRIYFEGTPEEIATTKDTYLKRFLV